MVLAPASSRYEGRALRAGAAAAVIMFVGLYWLNTLAFEFAPDALLMLLEAAAVGGLLAWMASRLDPLRRLLIPRWAMNAAVETASHATWSEENVSLTKDRNAVLLYVSVLEGALRLMPDIGLQQKLHEGKLGEIEGALANADHGDPVELVCSALRKLGECCKECFPLQDDDQNELPDRPQIRLP